MSESAKLAPYFIICRCVPSPHSNSRLSPSRVTTRPATLRSTVGRAAEVPRNRTLSTLQSEPDVLAGIRLEVGEQVAQRRIGAHQVVQHRRIAEQPRDGAAPVA